MIGILTFLIIIAILLWSLLTEDYVYPTIAMVILVLGLAIKQLLT